MKAAHLFAASALAVLAACNGIEFEFPSGYPTSAPTENRSVAINGRELDADDLAGFTAAYGTTLPAGAYWYDTRSGAIGVVGESVGGFLRPGHDLGSIDPAASRGDTGVFVNGRELPIVEWTWVSNVVGFAVAPGRYWIDHRGNYGYEGREFALGNLAASGASNSAGGGDGFWSSRYASGNANADNSAGYVYLPGTGSVSYGM
ncbi:MAG: hypothetical protein K8S98_09015 [Planctomycetes bacterium]|nr:hypothetical protein [Planctomycetota bacterium]